MSKKKIRKWNCWSLGWAVIELEKKPFPIQLKETRALMAEIRAERYPPDVEEWLLDYLLRLLIRPMSIDDRHKFLNELIKKGMH